MMNAVPPNFYAEKFSYIGATLIIEVALIIVLALLGGAGAAARLASLIARIKGIANKTKQGASALKAYVAMLEAFEKVITTMKTVANKMTASRRNKSTTGATAGTVHNPRKNKDKQKGCPHDAKFKKANLTYGEEEIIGG